MEIFHAGMSGLIETIPCPECNKEPEPDWEALAEYQADYETNKEFSEREEF